MIDFFKKPDELVARFKAKNPETHFDYDEIKHDAHKRVFTIAKMMNLDLLKDMQSSLTKAFHNGVTFDEFKNDIIPHLKKSGWWGEIEVTDPKSGKPKKVFVGARRLKRIFDTNLRTSYAGAKKQSLDESSLEYYRYTAVLDSRTRPTHRAMHGIILPKDHPFWKNNFPPNGWGCRCTVRGYSKKQLERKGLKPFSGKLPNVSHDDFSYDMSALDSAFKQKAKKVLNLIQNKDLETAIKEFDKKRDLYIWQKGLNELIEAATSGNIIKEKYRQIAQIGVLSDIILKSLLNLSIKPKAKSISIYQNTIKHTLRDTKPNTKKPNIDEIKQAVNILDKAKHVYYDKKENTLLYFYDKVDDNNNMITYIVVRLDYTLKKFKTDNFIATITKIPLINYKAIIKDKVRYKNMR
ncbi:phage minor head protein [Campylobacter ureolyticus]|uniref:phage head morphogenesis protein n=1 Tax=Campylobacter ureolyticus TaxID=827 RepID=UPI0022B2ED17|nr:phage minor head protein [Campylobacter ureolyticus]MCZ6135680.1 phage minor head protein [Campylobacter ureolyticus]